MATLKIRLRKKGDKLNEIVKKDISRITNIIDSQIENGSSVLRVEEIIFNLKESPDNNYNDLRGLVLAYNQTVESSVFKQKENEEKEKILTHYKKYFKEILERY